MLIKLISIVIVFVYSVTSPAVYPHKLTSALRPLSGRIVGVDAGVSAKMSSAGYLYISAACLEQLDNIVGADHTSPDDWYSFLEQSKATEEIAVFEIVYKEYCADLAGEVKEEISRRLELQRDSVQKHDDEKAASPFKWPVRVTVKPDKIIVEQLGSDKKERIIPRQPDGAAAPEATVESKLETEVSAEAADVELQLAENSAETESKEKIEPLPAATGTGGIELAPDESGVSKPPTEKPEVVLKKAAIDISVARTEQGVDVLKAEYLEHASVKGNDVYEKQINAMADKRKDELKKLSIVSQRLNKAMNSAVATDRGDKNTVDWLKEAYKVFTDAVEVKKILDGLGIKFVMTTNSLHSQASGLITKKKKLFKTWGRIVTSAESASENATTFHKLDLITEELKEKFGKFPECMKVPEAFIKSGRERLRNKQNTAIERIKPLVGVLCDEYKILDELLVEFKELLKKLNKTAKDKGFDDLTDAAKHAVDIVFIRGQKYLVKQKWTRWYWLRPLKKPLQEVVGKRTVLIEQLKRYMSARKAILDSFKPEDLALTEKDKEKGKFDAVINPAILEKMKVMEQDAPGITDRYRKRFKVHDIARFISNIDTKYIKPLWDKIELWKKKFKVLTAEALKTEKAAPPEKLIAEQDTTILGASVLATESKVLAAIGTQA